MAQPLSDLSVGDKVKFGRYQVNTETAEEIIWKIAAKNHVCTPAYPSNSVTLITEKIIDLRAADAKEPSNSDATRQNQGNNRYSQSNIDQWLNKDSATGQWYVAAHGADAPPSTSDSVHNYNTQYSAKAGFLNLFTIEEKSAIFNTTIRVVKATVDGGGYEDIARKIFLPSTTEVGLANEGGIDEGARWGLLTNNTNRVSYATQQVIDNSLSTSKPSAIDVSWMWRLRTPNATSPSEARYVMQSGPIETTRVAYGHHGLRPVCNLPSTLSASDTTDTDGCYTLTYWTPPNISTRVDGELKTYADGWVRVGGELKHITDMWARVNGVLKKL